MATRRSWTHSRGTRGWLYEQPHRPKKSDRETGQHRMALHGQDGSISWGHYEAAVLSSWQVAKDEGGIWRLTATAAHVVPIYLRQTRPTLLFTAPRQGLPPMCWPIQELGQQGQTIRARLGPIEF